MCGIAGSINTSLNTDEVIRSMGHRGPDRQSSESIDNVILVHARLSIIDSAGGAQPMRRNDLVIVFNGEIYNHKSLRQQFDLNCTTESDTETLLALFELLGTDCLKFLDGMFAFAIYNTRKKEITLARDRAGEKPLYYWKNGSSFMFASELNTIKSAQPLEVDEGSICNFLSSGVMYGKKTPYLDTEELLPGHFIELNTIEVKPSGSKWFSLEHGYNRDNSKTRSLKSCIDFVDEALNSAVRNQLLSSDLEVGAFLSGGIDSGLVCAMASLNQAQLKTFTVSFKGQFDESELANATAKMYKTDHTVLSIDYADLEDNIHSIISNYGEPISDDSIVPTWYVCRAAKEHVTVVLTGDGADEIFGGYRRYIPYSRLDLFQTSNSTGKLREALRFLPNPSTNKHNSYSYLHRFLALLGKNGTDRYISSTTQVSSSELLQKQQGVDFLADYNSLAESKNLSSLDKLMIMDFHALLGTTLLPKMDIGSMAHSLETRTPFLAKEVLDNAPSIPGKYKIKGTTTKYILRELSKKYLPADVTTAPKRGFETPLVNWVDGLLRHVIHDSLSTPNAYVRQFYSRNYVDKLLNTNILPPTQRARMIWMLFCTEVWYTTRVKTL
ncbi:asparagine synthase (glutamine-hydrolyzing) [Chromatiales bacterium (ex Bugula neritina AB1)]|nr:asparagine synthase (glutamine-hydrolyzing) [Chromatiales bacterium (ex Bugula neritina AB1)]